MNARWSSDCRGQLGLWLVSGKPSPSVSAQGQKPCRRAKQTDFTKGWFGWVMRSCSKRSTLMGVTTLSKNGCVRRVVRAATLLYSCWGGWGTGSAKKVSRTAGLSDSVRFPCASQRRWRQYFGLVKGFAVLSGRRPAFGLTMGLATFDADMGIFACISGAAASSLVVFAAGLGAVDACGMCPST